MTSALSYRNSLKKTSCEISSRSATRMAPLATRNRRSGDRQRRNQSDRGLFASVGGIGVKTGREGFFPPRWLILSPPTLTEPVGLLGEHPVFEGLVLVSIEAGLYLNQDLTLA